MNRTTSTPTKALLIALLSSFLFPVAAQKPISRKSVDPEQLRSRFTAAVKEDFEVIKDEQKEGQGGTYWLAYIKAKHPGYFSLTYRYNYDDPHYSHVEREFVLNVGPQGCRRGVPSYGSYFRFCVGDTIIFPVIINRFTEHQFTLTSTKYTKEQDEAFEKTYSDTADERLDRALVDNPVAANLRYVGRNSYRLLHRNGGYTLEGYATFEAEHPGRFNLLVSPMTADLPAAILSSVGAGSVPIIIVARDTPVTLIASRHEVRGYTRGFNGSEYVSSVSGDSFMVDLMVLQPGDRISLKYYTTIHRREFGKREDSQNESVDVLPPPIISKTPFSLKSDYNFTGWLTDYLPK